MLVSRTQTYDKRTFWGVAHWHFLFSELCIQKCQTSRVSPENTELQNSC